MSYVRVRWVSNRRCMKDSNARSTLMRIPRVHALVSKYDMPRLAA